MQTTRGLDRLVFFTDAVTAIAITLLVLPLVDSVTEAAHDGLSVEQFIGNNVAAISGFALSFVVIARLWLAHHSTFEHVRSYSRPLLLLNLFWAFRVVVLPLPTEMVSQFRTSALSVGVYIGTMAASSLTLTAMTLLIRKHPRLELEENPLPGREVFSSRRFDDRVLHRPDRGSARARHQLLRAVDYSAHRPAAAGVRSTVSC